MQVKLNDLIWPKRGDWPILRVVEIRGTNPFNMRYTAVPTPPYTRSPFDRASCLMDEFYLLRPFAAAYGGEYDEGDIVQHNGESSITVAARHCVVRGVLICPKSDRAEGYLVERLNLSLPLLFAPENSLKMIQRAKESAPPSSEPISLSVSTNIDPDIISSVLYQKPQKEITTDLCMLQERLRFNVRMLPPSPGGSIRTGMIESSEAETVITWDPREVKFEVQSGGLEATITLTRKKDK